MLGVLVNTMTVVVGSLVGMLCKKGIPKRLTDAVMLGIGLCTLYIGISGALKGENTLILIGSMVLGAISGTALNIDGGISRLGNWIQSKFKKNPGANTTVAEGFITASLLFCVGAMTIVGSLNAGLHGDNELLFTKATLDLVSATMLAASLGGGVLCAAVFVLGFQGAIVLLAQYLAPILTDAAIGEMTCAGSLLIVALGLNLMGITKIKVANYLPAMVFAPILCWIVTLF